MCKILKTLMVTLLCIINIVPAVSAAETVEINELIENSKKWDGQEVIVTGEAIGEALERGDYTWVNINDGTNAIGLWLKSEDAKKITYYGDYKHIGDKIQVTGLFSRDCKEHGGDVDIHCSHFEIVTKGRDVKEKVELGKVISSIVLLLITAFFGFLYFKFFKNQEIK